MANTILTEERERDDTELGMLEELWIAQPARERRSRSKPALAWLSARLGWVLAVGWLAFMTSVFFEPAPASQQTVPLWAEALVAGFFLSLGGAGITAAMRAGRSAYAVATVAGVFGLAVGAACGVTDHHPSGWWIYELGATGALTALAVTGLVRRR